MRSTTVSRFILAAALAASPLLAGRLAPAPTGVTPTIEHGVRRPAAGTLVRVDIHHLADLTSFRLPVGTLSNVSEAALVPATAPPPPPAPPPQAPSTPAQVAAATVAAMPTWEVQSWLMVHVCEEGENWHVEGGVSSGGLGILNENWAAHGGLEFAPDGGQATPDEQIVVAARIQSPPPWWPGRASGTCAGYGGW